jgi:hypothetical protein
MTSAALDGLLAGIAEVQALQRANPTPQQGGGFTRPEIVRAMGRAEVVLLSSHFERYLYALNEEACQFVVELAPPSAKLSQEIRLIHAREVVDELARMNWENREEKLRLYSEAEAALWRDDEPVTKLDPKRLLVWMKAPHVDSVVRMFGAITRTPVTQGRLRLRLGELVTKRNNIAHGDQTVEATYLDVQQYKAAVRIFCTRADGVFARKLAQTFGTPRPW